MHTSENTVLQSPVSLETKYEQLFRDTYWSHFDGDKNRDVITARIIANRNKFAEEMQLHEHIHAPVMHEP